MDNFTCTSCNGTGFWTPCGSQNYRGDRHCYTCNGKGRFKTSSEDRAKARTQRLARKDAKRVANLESGESQLTQALGEHGLAWLVLAWHGAVRHMGQCVPTIASPHIIG